MSAVVTTPPAIDMGMGGGGAEGHGLRRPEPREALASRAGYGGLESTSMETRGGGLAGDTRG